MAQIIKWMFILVIFIAAFYLVDCRNRSFTIDYDGDTFLKDGKPFRYISGSIHYSRVPAVHWKDRLTKMYAAGLNAIQFYVPWNFHEATKDVYRFTGEQDVEGFIRLAQEVGLLVILRAGPYICGEWEFGGFPAWLLQEDPAMVMRTMDTTFVKYVDKWLNVLYPRMKPLLYENGGPIISVQIENEYGSYFVCDFDYLRFLRQKAIDLLGPNVVLFSTDGDGTSYLKCGTLDGIYSTVDFGPGSNPLLAFQIQRMWEPKGPLVNSEYYTGWLDHWGGNHSVTSIDKVAKSLDFILSIGGNVNMYMFEGGTSFGYWNGANYPPFTPDPTSYDYDAPLTEAGDITDKYIALRQVISKYNKLPQIPIPPSTPKRAYGNVSLEFICTVQEMLTKFNPPVPVVKSIFPRSMEDIGHFYGYILYRHVLPENITSPQILSVSGIRDRGYVMVNGNAVGILERKDATKLNITGKAGQNVDILVENQGRINFGRGMNDNVKGIISNVLLNGYVVVGWLIYPLPLENLNPANLSVVSAGPRLSADSITPSLYIGKFLLPDKEPHDTYLDMTNFSKGQAFINGFNLGRYWPSLGPQIRLYVPKSVLMAPPAVNYVMLFETENVFCKAKTNCMVDFMDTPLINATVPARLSMRESQVSVLPGTGAHDCSVETYSLFAKQLLSRDP